MRVTFCNKGAVFRPTIHRIDFFLWRSGGRGRRGGWRHGRSRHIGCKTGKKGPRGDHGCVSGKG